MSAPTVFISYSHDSTEHAERVRGLHASLSRDGCECRLDVYKKTDEDWPLWMTGQLLDSNFVLCVVTETYARRFNDKELPNKGLGVGWEAGLIRRLLYQNKLHNDRVFPVLFERADEQHIPLELQGYDYFVLEGQAGYETLLRKALNRPLYAAPEVGSAPELQTVTSAALFDRPTDTPRDRIAEPAAARYDISRIDKYAPAELIGRESELKLLSDTWQQAVNGEPKRPRILTFVALGGEGKTSLVAKWTADLAYQGWPGCDAAFAWSFYSQGTSDKTQASSDAFLAEALRFFGDEETAGSAKSGYEKGKRLGHLVAEKNALLILDGVEPLQYAPGPPMDGKLKDDGVTSLLKALATKNEGLCVVTTRYSIPDLRAFWQTTAPEIKLARLSRDAGVHLLKTLSVKGTQQEFEILVADVKGHALTLNLLGTYLRDAQGGDIRKRDLVKLEEADAEEQSGHAFHVMDAYVASFKADGENGKCALSVLRLIGLFDRPASADCLNALWTGNEIGGLTGPLIGLTEAQRNLTLKRLQGANLLTVNREAGSGRLLSLDAHPLIREYFASRIREQLPGAWRAGHRRLYEYLVANTHEGDEPTLEDLQPLYQAVAHGCLAGLHVEVCNDLYHARIHQKVQYSLSVLGAYSSDLGAVACFYESLWNRVSARLPEVDQAWLLGCAAYHLRALGRFVEALEPRRTEFEMYVNQEVWSEAAKSAGNLSELELSLGDVESARKNAERALALNRTSGVWNHQRNLITILAHTHHQAAREDEAQDLFAQAETLQLLHQPSYRYLYSIEGFRYEELLASASERIAWQNSTLRNTSISRQNKPSHDQKLSAQIESLTDVTRRAAEALKIAEANRWLLEIALAHLSRGRASLFKLILENHHTVNAVDSDQSELHTTAAFLDKAVTGLRRAGTTHHIPRGLLTRSWLRTLGASNGSQKLAQSDLDEAWEIAERGPMRLFMADIHLYRARLFHAVKPYPWNEFPDGREGRGPKDDLKDARELIEKCGYWRRKEELEDAEEAAKGWT